MWRAFVWSVAWQEWRLVGSSRERVVLEVLYPEAEVIAW